MSERDGPISAKGSGPFIHDASSQFVLYIRKEHRKGFTRCRPVRPWLHLSPQRLRGDKALEIKRLFPREHVVHGPAQLVGEYGERFRFAVFMFQFRKILPAGLVVA